MFNRIKEIEKKVESLREAELQRSETPDNYLWRKCGNMFSTTRWLCFSQKDSKKYEKYPLFFEHGGDRFLIEIKKDN